jgi:hypothetical protein
LTSFPINNPNVSPSCHRFGASVYGTPPFPLNLSCPQGKITRRCAPELTSCGGQRIYGSLGLHVIVHAFYTRIILLPHLKRDTHGQLTAVQHDHDSDQEHTSKSTHTFTRTGLRFPQTFTFTNTCTRRRGVTIRAVQHLHSPGLHAQLCKEDGPVSAMLSLGVEHRTLIRTCRHSCSCSIRSCDGCQWGSGWSKSIKHRGGECMSKDGIGRRRPRKERKAGRSTHLHSGSDDSGYGYLGIGYWDLRDATAHIYTFSWKGVHVFGSGGG